jgi:hypothetical protein
VSAGPADGHRETVCRMHHKAGQTKTKYLH